MIKPIDGQEIATGFIVIAAALYVGKRLLDQILAFRTAAPKSGKSGDAGCGGCGGGKDTTNAKPRETPLVQIQTRPPVRLRRPPLEKP